MLNNIKKRLKSIGLQRPVALPMRGFCKPGDYTWEDWKEETKAAQPIKWFLFETLPAPARKIRTRLNNLLYWIKCHTLTSHKYHLLDLRKPGPGLTYNYGYLDKPEVILFACFISLRDYFEKEQPEDPRTFSCSSEEERLLLKKHIDFYVEAKDLYDWWMVGRVKEEQTSEKLWHKCNNSNSLKDRQRWLKYEELKDLKVQVQLERLIKIREGLWT
jgi:hypothetical protein